jgi:hypothetical protein
MSDRIHASRVLAIVVAVVWLAAPSVAGQTGPAAANAQNGAAKKGWTPPVAPDGRPDLQGVWLSNSATPLERPKALEGRRELTDEEVTELKKRAARLFKNGTNDYAAGDNAFLVALADPAEYKSPGRTTGGSIEMVEREFDNQTSLIVDPPDGKIPPLTPEAQQRRAAAARAGQRLPEGPEDLRNDVRCLTFGTPRVGGNYGAGPYSYYQILQAPGYVVLVTEAIHEARIIPLDGRPRLPQGIGQWSGESRGRWEGNILVVETTNFSSKNNFMGSAERLHLVERFTRVAADTIRYEVTLDDPTMWTRPWTVAIPLKQSQGMIYEFACHEGNRDIMHGILAGARADERAAEESARGPK